MFLSRVLLNPRRRDARRLLSSPQRLHAAVLGAFPDPPTGDVDGPRVLWRLDIGHEKTWLYVASPGKPDFQHVIDQAGWPASDQGWETHEYRKLFDRLDVGQRWRFRLTANPVHRVRLSDAEPTKRRALLSVQSREDWLAERATHNGFRVASASNENGDDLGPDLVLTGMDVANFSRRDPASDSNGPREKRRVTISRTRYDGLLEVTDVDALTTALTTGIGPAKGYGCGLMTLAPA